MKRLLLMFCLVGMACSSTTLAANTVTPVLQPSTTITALTMTSTLQPSATALPTAVQLPTSTQIPPVISIKNIDQVKKEAEMSSPSLRKVVFSPDGAKFATAAGNDSDFGVKIWKSQGGALVQSFTGYSGIVWDLAFSPDGQWIASASNDQNGQHVRIWNVSDGRLLITLAGPEDANSLAFSPDGAWLAVGGTSGGWPLGVIWVYDTKSWKQMKTLIATGQNVSALVFDRDNNHLISSGTDGTIRVWTVVKETEQRRVSHGLEANRLALSPDGSLAASTFCSISESSGCTKGGVVIWRTSDWAVVQQFNDLAESLAFSSDGSMLVSGSGANDPVIRIRQINDWTVIKTLPGQTFSVAMSPDSQLLVTTSLDKITIWGLH